MAASESSRKPGHLEACKRKLEEFRKRKAEVKAKKVVAGSQSQPDGFDYRDMLLLESEKENIRGLDKVMDLALPMRKSSFDSRTALLAHECSFSNRTTSGMVVNNAVDDPQRLRPEDDYYGGEMRSELDKRLVI